MATSWPFLGRQHELALLRQRLRGDGGIVLIHGPRRSGASSLLRQAASGVRGSRWLDICIPDGGPGPVLAAWNRAMQRTDPAAELPDSLPEAVGRLADWLHAGGHVVLDGVHRLHRPAFKPMLKAIGRVPQGRGTLVLIGVHGADLDAVTAQVGHLPEGDASRVAVGDLEPAVLARLCRDAGRAQALSLLIGGLPGRWRIASRCGVCTAGPTRMLERLLVAREEFALEAEVSFAPMLIGRMGEILQNLATVGPLGYGALRAALVPAGTRTRDEPSSYLRILEQRWRIIERVPGDDAGSPAVRYRIADPFLCTWLRNMEPAGPVG